MYILAHMASTEAWASLVVGSLQRRGEVAAHSGSVNNMRRKQG